MYTPRTIRPGRSYGVLFPPTPSPEESKLPARSLDLGEARRHSRNGSDNSTSSTASVGSHTLSKVRSLNKSLQKRLGRSECRSPMSIVGNDFSESRINTLQGSIDEIEASLVTCLSSKKVFERTIEGVEALKERVSTLEENNEQLIKRNIALESRVTDLEAKLASLINYLERPVSRGKPLEVQTVSMSVPEPIPTAPATPVQSANGLCTNGEEDTIEFPDVIPSPLWPGIISSPELVPYKTHRHENPEPPLEDRLYFDPEKDDVVAKLQQIETHFIAYQYPYDKWVNHVMSAYLEVFDDSLAETLISGKKIAINGGQDDSEQFSWTEFVQILIAHCPVTDQDRAVAAADKIWLAYPESFESIEAYIRYMLRPLDEYTQKLVSNYTRVLLTVKRLTPYTQLVKGFLEVMKELPKQEHILEYARDYLLSESIQSLITPVVIREYYYDDSRKLYLKHGALHYLHKDN
ncbi:hypothetical protein TRVA0_030S01134 [Trichomonascus vanleenenianus]|uniref:uncharacterized protein n=1 Tax=Trichomonascus vanleenenianus TaxID=2268995 RepID=UPI003EC97481